MVLRKEVTFTTPPEPEPTLRSAALEVGLMVAALATVSFVLAMAIMGTIAWVSHDFDDDWVFEFSCEKHKPAR